VPWLQQIDTNLVSCFLCCAAAVNAIGRSGQGGRIVNVSARHAPEWRTGAGMVAYTATKAAVAALTVALSEEVAKEGILVNSVAPSIMDTPANRAAMPKANHKAWPKVDEVAASILFLASPENKVTRGAIVPTGSRDAPSAFADRSLRRRCPPGALRGPCAAPILLRPPIGRTAHPLSDDTDEIEERLARSKLMARVTRRWK
jgi:short-subunit dehydrogenase